MRSVQCFRFAGPLRGLAALGVAFGLGVSLSCDGSRRFSHYPPSVLEAPVFFEQSAERFGDRRNLELLFENKVRISPLGTFDVAEFDWRTHTRNDQSFWIRMERNDYLIPLLERWTPEDRGFLEEWVTRWLDVHEADWWPNQGSYDDMGIGKRGMVFAWYLRRLRQSETDNVLLLERLTRAIKAHQTHLEEEENFTTQSNHGVWEALGLFETTRVIENHEVTRLSLDRLIRIAGLSISAKGFHREHSPSYHFYVLGWFDEIVPYLQSLDLRWAQLDSLAGLHSRMREMTWYLCDHDLNLPQIGDTDATKLAAEPSGRDPSEMPASVFDAQAGYAIFKDPPGAPARRYIVFCCQNKRELPAMQYHFHDDVLAVYYSDDGEVILGDTGRYSYTSTPIRDHARSAEAHNTIVSRSDRGWQISDIRFADDAREVRAGGRSRFEAALWGGLIKREVEIPHGGAGFSVHDRIVATDSFSAFWHIGHDVATCEPGPPSVLDSAEVHRWLLTTKRGRAFELLVRIETDFSSAGPAVDTVRGLEAPYRGWYSSGYRRWEPATLLSITVAPGGRAKLTMEINPVQ